MRFNLLFKRIHTLILFSCLIGTVNPVRAQRNPTAQSLPFSFLSMTGSSLPAGVVVHSFGNTDLGGTIPNTRILTPGITNLEYVTSPPDAGGWFSANGGTDGIAMLATSDQKAGAVVVAVNTVGKTNIRLRWIARTIFAQDSRDNSLALQYRLGTSGDFIDLGNATHIYTSSGKAAGHFTNFSIFLPVELQGKSVVQLRWVYWESAGTGKRDRIALDNVIVEEAPLVDLIPPLAEELTPDDDATDVAITSNLLITFSEDVIKGTGDILIANDTDNTSETISLSSSDVSVVNNMVTIAGATLLNSKAYHVTLQEDSFFDMGGNSFAGITDPTMWNFSTVDDALPVNYISFEGNGVNEGIKLKWKTASEKNNHGFDILKSTTGANFEKIGFISGNATTSLSMEYEFNDFDVLIGGTYYYRLRQKDFDGVSVLSRIVAVHANSSGGESYIYPNPGTGSFKLAAKNLVNGSVKLFNILGASFPVTIDETNESGFYSVQTKSSLLPGVYLLKFEERGQSEQRVLNVIIR